MSSANRGKSKIPTSHQIDDLENSPFSSLNLEGLQDLPLKKQTLKVKKQISLGNRERLEVRREKSGRGGKTVTTIRGFPTYLGQEKLNQILKTLKSSLGTGGTWSNSTMELQGDRRKEVSDWLEEAGFKPVFAGG